jgi:hypothetical protein
MIVRSLARLILLAAAFALATAAIGWWTVPVVAALWGVMGGTLRRVSLTSALAAALGWGILLAWGAMRGPVAELAGKLGGVMQLPPFVLVAATIVFPALLAWSATVVARAATRRA